MLLGFAVPAVSYGIFVVVLLVVIVYYSFAPVARPIAGAQRQEALEESP